MIWVSSRLILQSPKWKRERSGIQKNTQPSKEKLWKHLLIQWIIKLSLEVQSSLKILCFRLSKDSLKSWNLMSLIFKLKKENQMKMKRSSLRVLSSISKSKSKSMGKEKLFEKLANRCWASMSWMLLTTLGNHNLKWYVKHKIQETQSWAIMRTRIRLKNYLDRLKS